MTEDEISRRVLDCAFRIHRVLGPGLFESVYSAALEKEFVDSDLQFVREASIQVAYEGTPLGVGFRADFIVEQRIILEVKSVELLAPVHMKQLLNYLKLSNLRLGLLLNFNVPLLKNGIVRIANNL